MTTDKTKAALDELNAMRMRLKAIDGTYDWEDSYKTVEQALTAQAEAQDENPADNVSIDFGDLVGEIRSYFEPRPIPNGIQYGIDRVYAAIMYEASQAEAQTADDVREEDINMALSFVRNVISGIESNYKTVDKTIADKKVAEKAKYKIDHKLEVYEIIEDVLLRAVTAPKNTDAEREKALGVLNKVEYYIMKHDPRSGIKDPCDKATLTRAQIDAIKSALRAPAAVPQEVVDALRILYREAKAVADDYHRPRYSRLDDALSSVEALLGGKEGDDV